MERSDGVEFYKSGLFEFACFLGGGGGALGSVLDGRRIIGACEIDQYRTAQILARQKDNLLPWFPIWDDIRTLRQDNPETTEMVERLRKIRNRLVISGGFPCQDISPAGKGKGIYGERSGLFFEFARFVSEIRPRFWFMENSPALIVRGFDRVLGTISEMGYNARWCVIGADNAGAPHKRKRIWILAYPNEDGFSRDEMRNSSCRKKRNSEYEVKPLLLSHWPPGPGSQSEIPRMANGVPDRVDRIKTIGDGQVPAVAQLAWKILSEGLI